MLTLHPILEQLDGNLSLASSNSFQTPPGLPEAQCIKLRTFDGKWPPSGSAERQILLSENVALWCAMTMKKMPLMNKEFTAIFKANVDFFIKWDELFEIYSQKNGANMGTSRKLSMAEKPKK